MLFIPPIFVFSPSHLFSKRHQDPIVDSFRPVSRRKDCVEYCTSHARNEHKTKEINYHSRMSVYNISHIRMYLYAHIAI